MFYNTGNPAVAFTQAGNLYTLPLQTAITRLAPYALHLNQCIRKYIGGHNKQRIALFLAHVLLETDRWRSQREYGHGAPNNNIPNAQYYTAFFGRGMMQLTWAGNFKAYGIYKNIPNHQGAYAERRQNIQPRITATSQHYSSNPQVHHQDGSITIDDTKLFQWSPRYDPDIISENAHYACDSGGYFWVSTPISGSQTNLNRLTDREYSANNIRVISTVINGGGHGYTDRQAYSAFMLRYLTDDANTSTTVVIPAVQVPGLNTPKPAVTANMTSAE
jgi:hydroxyethylthiazole kinase